MVVGGGCSTRVGATEEGGLERKQLLGGMLCEARRKALGWGRNTLKDLFGSLISIFHWPEYLPW